MRHMSEQEYNIRLEKIKERNESKERKHKLKQEKRKYGFKIQRKFR